MEELIEKLFSPGGLLQQSIAAYEERLGQKEMAKELLQSYLYHSVLLVEAGTGIGKSMAYLAVALLWAAKKGEKTLVSTHTIALQEQLLYKDIPLLLDILGLELKVVLVKGMNNYLCLRRLEERGETLLERAEQEDLEKIYIWKEYTREGSRSDIPFALSPSSWSKVSVDGKACNHIHCPHFKNCFFFKARREVEEAQLLVVNHSLLLTEMAARARKKGKEEKSALPAYDRLIVDEAHHLEETAIDAFSAKLDRVALHKLLGELYAPTAPESTLLYRVSRQLEDSISPGLEAKLSIDLPAQRGVASQKIEDAFAALEAFSLQSAKKEEEGQFTVLLDEKVFATKEWKERVLPPFTELKDSLVRLALQVDGLIQDLEKREEKVEGVKIELQSFAQQLEERADAMVRFLEEKSSPSRVRYVQKREGGLHLVDADLAIFSHLQENLYPRLKSLALCSATLTAEKSFSFLKHRLGLQEAALQKKIVEKIFDSPFDYQKKSLLAVPSDLPMPHEREFVQRASEMIEEIIAVTKGGVFVLFTSYEMLQSCFAFVSSSNKVRGLSLMKQGDLSRQKLIQEFKSKDKSVLFGTDSFWEGVDVPGSALRCVIIVKLPFHVPSDPIVQRQSDLVEKAGKSAFFDFSVPQAAIKFKQGFGRLIRRKEDWGVVICLDKRLVTKGYGKAFLKTLPEAPLVVGKQAKVLEEIERFFVECGRREWSVAESNR